MMYSFLINLVPLFFITMTFLTTAFKTNSFPVTPTPTSKKSQSCSECTKKCIIVSFNLLKDVSSKFKHPLFTTHLSLVAVMKLLGIL